MRKCKAMLAAKRILIEDYNINLLGYTDEYSTFDQIEDDVYYKFYMCLKSKSANIRLNFTGEFNGEIFTIFCVSFS